MRASIRALTALARWLFLLLLLAATLTVQGALLWLVVSDLTLAPGLASQLEQRQVAGMPQAPVTWTRPPDATQEPSQPLDLVLAPSSTPAAPTVDAATPGSRLPAPEAATPSPRPTRTPRPATTPSPHPSITAPATTTPGTPLPSLPAPSVSVSLRPDEITLAWNATAGTRYRVYSNLGSGLELYTLVAETGEEAWTDEEVRPGRQYRYQVVAVSGGATSAPVLVSVSAPEWPWRMAGAPGYGAPTGGATGPTATATPAPPSLELVGRNAYLDSAGRYHIVALFRNEGGQDAVNVSAELELRDEEGALIERRAVDPYLTSVPVGGLLPIHVIEEGGAPPSYRISARGTPGSSVPSPLVVEASSANEEGGVYYVQGRVRNGSPTLFQAARVVVLLVDRQGRPVNSMEVNLVPADIRSGQSATFQARFSYYPRVASHHVFVMP